MGKRTHLSKALVESSHCKAEVPSPRYHLPSWEEWQRAGRERDGTTCTNVSWLFFVLSIALISEASLYETAI